MSLFIYNGSMTCDCKISTHEWSLQGLWFIFHLDFLNVEIDRRSNHYAARQDIVLTWKSFYIIIQYAINACVNNNTIERCVDNRRFGGSDRFELSWVMDCEVRWECQRERLKLSVGKCEESGHARIEQMLGPGARGATAIGRWPRKLINALHTGETIYWSYWQDHQVDVQKLQHLLATQIWIVQFCFIHQDFRCCKCHIINAQVIMGLRDDYLLHY